MPRSFTACQLAVVMCAAAIAAPASAQIGPGATALPVARIAALPHAELEGTVIDSHGAPLAGVVVSALGSATAFVLSDRDGHFAFRNLRYGPYLLRAHLEGYHPARARLVQVNHPLHSIQALELTRQEEDAPISLLTAGVGGPEVTSTSGDGEDAHDHGEVAWRLRHLKRSVLKDTAAGLIDLRGTSGSFFDDPLAGLSRAVGTPARVATSLLADVPWTGRFDLLTTTSFDSPADLLSAQTWMPKGVAFLSLDAPTGAGDWAIRGAIRQSDLSSWIVAGSYRRAPAVHRYEAGLSYGTQAALLDTTRSVGAMYAYDEWTVTPRLVAAYGAKYARYDYLQREHLLSPRASLTVTPTADERFRVRAAIARTAIAPGAEEFIPPSSGGVWLPPERVFSSVSRGFTSESVEHVEIAAEREWAGGFLAGVRAFHQRVDDQLATVFGTAVPGSGAAASGHYYVASAGDVDTRGWGISMSRAVANRVRASIDYSDMQSAWVRRSPDAIPLSLFALSLARDEEKRSHDLTTSIDSTLPLTDTHILVIYKMNSRFANSHGLPITGARFDVRVNQSLPFMNFSNAQWEMLVAVRSLFHDDLLEASVYDEVLVVRPPKRLVGGVTVRF
jgi:hypothetical protein